MGITTCGALGRASLPLLTRRFGVIGEQLKAMGNGKLDRPLEVVPAGPEVDRPQHYAAEGHLETGEMLALSCSV